MADAQTKARFLSGNRETNILTQALQSRLSFLSIMKIAGRRAAIKRLCYLNFQQSLNMQCFQTCSLLQPPAIFSNASWDGSLHNLSYIILQRSPLRLPRWKKEDLSQNTVVILSHQVVFFLLFLQLTNANHKASPPALHWRHFFLTLLTRFFWDHLDALIPPILYGQLQTIVPTGLRCSEKHTQAGSVDKTNVYRDSGEVLFSTKQSRAEFS